MVPPNVGRLVSPHMVIYKSKDVEMRWNEMGWKRIDMYVTILTVGNKYKRDERRLSK